METAATPVENNGGTPPTAPAATPAEKNTETVTLSKEVHDQMARDAARAASNQRKADLYDRVVGGKGTRFNQPSVAKTEVTPEEREAVAATEDRKAERGLLSLALDPEYRDVIDSDPTLRELLTKNPLAVLPILAPDALDAEDAIGLVKEALKSRKKPSVPPASEPAPAKPTPAAPSTPPPGGINTPDGNSNDEYEKARKNPKTENAIAGMVKARINQAAKK